MNNPEKPTVAVITSTIGRTHLGRAIQSVKSQTYPCKHYVFVDGEKFAEDATKILDKYPDVITTYLPMNTGADGWTNSSINAIAPFLVKEDIICYLDDDNWYEPNHVELGVKALIESGADYAFSLRNFCSEEGELITQDLIESIGHYDNRLPNPFSYNIHIKGGNSYTFKINLNKREGHIDTNCYFMLREFAVNIARSWYSGKHNDTNVYQTIKANGAKGVCSKGFTVNYVLDVARFMPSFFTMVEQIAPHFSQDDTIKLFYDVLRLKSQTVLKMYDNQYPWEII